MSKILNKDLFKVIDLEYWEQYGVEGLETVIARKEESLEEQEEKEDCFWALMNKETTTVRLTNGTVIKGFQLKKLGGYKALCSILENKGYGAFDNSIQKEEDLGYGETQKVTVYKAVDKILSHFGLETPKGKKAIRVYRDIFWVSRRYYKRQQHDIEELEELKLLKEFKEDENNSFDETELSDFLEESDTNIDFFGLE